MASCNAALEWTLNLRPTKNELQFQIQIAVFLNDSMDEERQISFKAFWDQRKFHTKSPHWLFSSFLLPHQTKSKQFLYWLKYGVHISIVYRSKWKYLFLIRSKTFNWSASVERSGIIWYHWYVEREQGGNW